MIPRIQTGSSFAGAGLYYLHDKRRDGETERLTTERVAWTYAINTLDNEPEAVLAEMRQTAFDQPYLKMTSGNRVDGRPTEKPVMTIALAWSPEQSPTRDQMIEAGHSYLQHMGWEGHQALFVAHNDTKHPHMHILINRIHHETGMGLDDAWSKTRAQQWALEYERENGQVFCKAREAKYGRGESTNAPEMHRSEWKLWQEIKREGAHDPEFQRALQSGEWDQLRQNQKDERLAFWKESAQQRKETRKAVREEVRDRFADDWHDYSRHRDDAYEAKARYDQEARHAIKHYTRLHGLSSGRREKFEAFGEVIDQHWTGAPSAKIIQQIKERQKEFHKGVREQLTAEREGIQARQVEYTRALSESAFTQLEAQRAVAYEALKLRHREDRAELKHDQAAGDRRHDLLPGARAPKVHNDPLAHTVDERIEKRREDEKRVFTPEGRAERAEKLGKATQAAERKVDTWRAEDEVTNRASTPRHRSEVDHRSITQVRADVARRRGELAAQAAAAATAAAQQQQANRKKEEEAQKRRADPPGHNPARDDPARIEAARAAAVQQEQTKRNQEAEAAQQKRPHWTEAMLQQRAAEKGGHEVTDRKAAAAKHTEQTDRKVKENEAAKQRHWTDAFLQQRAADRDRGGGGRER